MNQLVTRALCLVVLCASACAKKEPKPLRTEPWLAHPPASAAASSDAAVPATRYAITEQSVIRFELPSKRGALRGTLTRVSGELRLVLDDLTRSSGQVRADLTSLTLQGPDESRAATLLSRARSALDVSDAGAPAPSAVFDLTALEDLAPAQLEPAPSSDAGSPFTRRARATAVGDLLLHGFRVVRRAPLEAEFGFTADRTSPSTVLIRSRAPFVISLETHAIQIVDGEGRAKAPSSAPNRAREVRVSIELYGRKVD